MDIRRLLRSLLDHKVRFLVIGAWAMPAYGYQRMTRDLDIFFEPTRANARRLQRALAKVGYVGIEDIPIEEMLSKKILMRQYLFETDTHPMVKGAEFKMAWKARVKTDIRGVSVHVPSLEDLISMKMAAGRRKDKGDLEVLRRIQKSRMKS